MGLWGSSWGCGVASAQLPDASLCRWEYELVHTDGDPVRRAVVLGRVQGEMSAVHGPRQPGSSGSCWDGLHFPDIVSAPSTDPAGAPANSSQRWPPPVLRRVLTVCARVCVCCGVWMCGCVACVCLGCVPETLLSGRCPGERVVAAVWGLAACGDGHWRKARLQVPRVLGVSSPHGHTASASHAPEQFWPSEKRGFPFPEVREFILGNPGFTA